MEMQMTEAPKSGALQNLNRSKVVSAVAGAGVVSIAGFFVFPILTTVLWNTLNFGIAAVSVAAFLWLVTNKKLRLNLFYLWEILMRKSLGIIIALDPFEIAQDYIDDMISQREIFNKKAEEVDTVKVDLDRKIIAKQKELDHQVSLAKSAAKAISKDSSYIQEQQNALRQAKRLEDSILQLAPIRNNLTKVGDYLNRMYKNSKYTIEDAQNALAVEKDTYEAVTKSSNALNSALKFFTGDPDKKLAVEQAAGVIQLNIAGKLASMKKSISATSDYMRTIDLDNATSEEEGLKFIETYDPESFMKLTAPEKKMETVQVGKVNSNYNDLLN
jgi:hypothetical protein